MHSSLLRVTEEATHLVLSLALDKLLVAAVCAERTADERHQLQIRGLRRFWGDGKNNDLDRGVVDRFVVGDCSVLIFGIVDNGDSTDYSARRNPSLPFFAHDRRPTP